MLNVIKNARCFLCKDFPEMHQNKSIFCAIQFLYVEFLS